MYTKTNPTLVIGILLGAMLLFSGCLSKAPAVTPPLDGGAPPGNSATPPPEADAPPDVETPPGGPPPSHTGWITQEENGSGGFHRRAYEPFLRVRREGAVIPGLKQGLVPQSVAYLAEMDWLLIAGYRDNDSSLLTVVDASTDELVKTVQFNNINGTRYRGHAGGLAISDQHVWLSSGGYVYYVAVADIIAARDTDAIRFAGQVRIDARGSFVSYADGILWAGDFYLARDTKKEYPTETHHHLTNRTGGKYNGWVAGYELDPATDLIANTSDRPRTKQGALLPDMVLSIPEKTQEISVIGNYIVLSQSYGRSNVSTIKIYDNPLQGVPHATDPNYRVPVWFLDNMNLAAEWTVPSMLEGLTVRHHEAFVIFESAADKYLRGLSLYPLSRLQIVDVAVLLAGP